MARPKSDFTITVLMGLFHMVTKIVVRRGRRKGQAHDRIGLCILLVCASALAVAVQAAAVPARLPAWSFQDQEGRTWSLASLQGRVAVIVCGGRRGLAHHVAWGARLDADFREHGLSRDDDPPEARPVRIVALAQMGGVPSLLRAAILPFVRRETPPGVSTWLDREDRMSRAFGASDAGSTIVVADREGLVRLVVAGVPDDPAWLDVVTVVRRLA
jgi:hypothetical protein